MPSINLQEEQDEGGSFLALIFYLLTVGLLATALIALVYAAVQAYIRIVIVLIVIGLVAIYATGMSAYFIASWARCTGGFSLLVASVTMGFFLLYFAWIFYIYIEGMQEGLPASAIREIVGGWIPNPLTLYERVKLIIQMGDVAGGTDAQIMNGLKYFLVIGEALALVIGPALAAFSFVNEDLEEQIADGLVSRF